MISSSIRAIFLLPENQARTGGLALGSVSSSSTLEHVTSSPERVTLHSAKEVLTLEIEGHEQGSLGPPNRYRRSLPFLLSPASGFPYHFLFNDSYFLGYII